jgi:hypothetical protein
MTIKEMVRTLVDKGHGRDWAEGEAAKDVAVLMDQNCAYGLPPETMQECSVCRRWFTDLQMKYHYHPCE